MNSSPWKETIYNVAGWGQSLRGLVPFQRNQTIRYDKTNMELTAATSAAITSMGYEDTNFLFTICLDHRMRVWDVRTGQILYTGDMLNAQRDPQEVGKWVIEPSQTNLIRIVNTAQGQCLVVTYSPIGAGEFKFWKVKGNDQGSILVADCFPNNKLTPQAPSSLDVWTLADFGVAQGDESPEIWTLWKNNFTYRVMSLQLRPTSSAGPWSAGWKAVFLDNVPPAAQTSSSCDPTDATERWLDLIFFPGRFARSTLETALAMYEKGSGSAKDTSSRGSKTLAESICAVIGSTTTLDQGSTGRMDYDQFRASSEVQWRRFYRLLIELDKQRGEALSLVVDTDLGMPWILCADIAATVRQCSSLDLVCHNMSAPEKNSEDVAALVKTGLDFIDNFSDGMWQLCRSVLQSEMFEDSAKTDEERLQYFSDKAGFWRQVTEEECNQVVESLGSNFRTVTPSLYEDLFDLLRADSDENSRELEYAFTTFGRGIIVRAAQDTSELQWQILFSQLILLVHMEFEFDNEEDALHSRFDVGAIYRKIISALRRLEHVKWMAKTEMNAPVSALRRSSSISGTSSPTASKRREEPQVITALEGLLGHLLGLSEEDTLFLMGSVTSVVTNLCAHDSDIELLPHLHQCFLLKVDRPDLALQLSPFAEQDAFSTYIQGRVFLALQDYDAAALYFKKAAIGLSKYYCHPSLMYQH
jgi:nuclear pore complex protein Nup160